MAARSRAGRSPLSPRIDSKTPIVEGKSCQRSREPVLLIWKEIEVAPEGDFFVQSGPGTVRLAPNSGRVRGAELNRWLAAPSCGFEYPLLWEMKRWLH